jgi:RimJ/RimL family protein N-acetyltransferase
MDYEVIPADRPPPELRERYFRSFAEPQVHYIEQRVGAAQVFVIQRGALEVGYAAIHGGAVVEFFAVDQVLSQLCEIFQVTAERGGAASAVVKSYDPLMLVAATGRPAHVAVIGVNCTSWSDERFEPPAGFAAQPGRADDLATVQAIQPGLYEHPDEIAHDLQAGRITIYELAGEPVGCGVLSPVREDGGALDLGVGVLPAWRRRGLGEQIVRHLKVVCLQELGLQPTCGCAVENVGSRRTLERAGFLTRHRLLELTWAS